ncbi:MAG: hypothetical protein AAGJ85_01400, partial [Pseudomonadota bacterium]
MAKVPGVETLEQRRPVIGAGAAPVPGNSGAALSGLASQIAELVEAKEVAKRKGDLADAEIEIQRGFQDMLDEADALPDHEYGTIHNAYSKQREKLREGILSRFDNEEDKQAIERAFEVRSITADSQIGKTEDRKYVAFETGRRTNALQTTMGVIANPNSAPDARLAAEDAYLNMLDAQRGTVIDDAEYARLRAGFLGEVSFEEGKQLAEADPDALVTMLGDPEAFGELSPQQRARLEKLAEIRSKEVDKQELVLEADELWLQSDGDYATAMQKVGGIADTEKRLAMESRMNTLKAQDNAMQSETQSRVREGMMEVVVQGKGMASMPSDLIADADVFTLEYIRDEIRQRELHAQRMSTLSAQEKAALKQQSDISGDFVDSIAATEPELYLSGPAVWRQEDPELYAEYMRMTPEKRSALMVDISERKARGGTADAIDATFKDLVRAIPQFGPENMRGEDFDGVSESRGKAAREEKAVVSALRRYAREYSEA